VDQIFKSNAFSFQEERVYERANLFVLDCLMRIDLKNERILVLFQDFLKQDDKYQNEKVMFKFADYLDQVDRTDVKVGEEEAKKRKVQKIFYYIKSLSKGHKYIW